MTKITRENCYIIVDYIHAFITEVSPAQTYRINTINKLKQFAEFHNPKAFKDMTRQDVIDYLDSFRRPESVDPLHQWIGSYETSRVYLLRFFKWLHTKDLEPDKRPKPTVMENIPKIKRKEVSIYKPTDLRSEEDDALFYKYCPSPRDRCWHALSRDTGCRPHEMLKLNIKDVVIKQFSSGHHVAIITVNGKTGTRSVRINNAYPRFKEWLSNGHPYPNIPDVYLFCGIGKKNTGRRLSDRSFNALYNRYKDEHFPKLLTDPTLSEEDKRKIRDLLKKPWNPYIRRHTAATEISKALKDPVLVDGVMGWSKAGDTRMKYQHYYANDSVEAMLTVMDGEESPYLDLKGSKNKNLLKPIQCPNCSEPNIPQSKFCAKCKFVLSFDAFNETLQEGEQSKKRLERLETRLKQGQ